MALVISFKGIKASSKCFDFSVVGNAKVDVITFKFTEPLDSVYTLEQLSSLNAYVKVESAGKGYIDKISATSTYHPAIVQPATPEHLEVSFTLHKKTTQFRNIDVQVQFETSGGEMVSQSEIVAIKLKGTIPADEEIPDKYPSVLQELEGELENHEERIETLESASEDTYTKAETDALLNEKVDKVEGKGLSENDFTDSYKSQVEANTQKVSANNGKITLQKNGSKVDDFNVNQEEDKTINFVIPTQASDVKALPDTTKYGASLSLTINPSTYVITAQLKDQNGDNLGNAQTIDLPLESVVVSGSYDSQSKMVILTLQNGSTIEFSVADLVSGLQSEITPTNKLSADLVDDSNTTNQFVSSQEKQTWNNKANKVSGGTTNNLASIDENGNYVDSGIAKSNVATKDGNNNFTGDNSFSNINPTKIKSKNVPNFPTDLTKKYKLVQQRTSGDLEWEVEDAILSLDLYAPQGDSTELSGISVQIKDSADHIIASGTYNGETLKFNLPIYQSYKIVILTQSLTIGGITYFAPEVSSGSSEGTILSDTSVVYRYSSTQSITSLNALKTFIHLPDIDIATKRLAVVRNETNAFSINITITNPETNAQYTMPLYVMSIDTIEKLVDGQVVSDIGARISFGYALPNSVPFDEREQIQCESSETFQDGIYYYSATTSGIGDKVFTPLVAGTDYNNGDSIATYQTTNNVYVFKHAWSNTQYGSGNKSTANVIRYGSNVMHESNVHKWLNGQGTDWFVASHLGDRLGSWYSGKHGFKDWFSASDLALIEDNVAYGVYERDEFLLTNNKIYCMFILPSGTELAGSVNNNEGTVFDYWKYLNGGVISNNANADRTIKKITNITSPQYSWLRSPYRSYSCPAWLVGTSGDVSGNTACGGYAVLPTFTI